MDLKNKKALVTGGTRGIGRAIAQALIAEGAQVVITGRNPETAAVAAKEIGAIGIGADVSLEADCVRSVEVAAAELGGLDVLINNAGIGKGAPLVETDLAMFQEVWSVNVAGAMMMARECAKRFIAQSSGHIVNVGSTSGLRGGARATAYSSSKFALRGMTECWRDELRRHNIRVTLVAPSEVQTEWGGRDLSTINPKKLVPEDIAQAVIGILKIDDRGFVPEFAVFATNPF